MSVTEQDKEINDLISELYKLEDDMVYDRPSSSIHDYAGRLHTIALKLNKWNTEREIQKLQAEMGGKYEPGTSKLAVFSDVFHKLVNIDPLSSGEVKLHTLTDELCSTGIFSPNESRKFIRFALRNGAIYERKKGVYALANEEEEV